MMISKTLLNQGYFQGINAEIKGTQIIGMPYEKEETVFPQNIKEEDIIPLTLIDAFQLRDSDLEAFNRGLNMAIDGDGEEVRRMLTIYSSSLLALLCFFSVSEKNPLEINKEKYTEVFFEVKNLVIKKDGRRPSNVDIVLVSKSKDGRIKKLLFLESKFTEYIHHGHVQLANKYHLFYNYIRQNIKSLQFNISEFIVHHRDGSTSDAFGLWSEKRLYLEGIKQTFSHLLGIVTGPAEDNNINRRAYKDYFHRAEEIEFGTILHDWNWTEFENYKELYYNTFKHEEIIKEGLRNERNSKLVERLKIHPEPFTYSNIFRNFSLPGIIGQAYKIGKGVTR